MAKKLNDYISSSQLFSGDSSDDLDYSKLTPDQQLALQRQGRTARVNQTSNASGIYGSRSNVEKAILDTAGADLASGDSLIVPNAQRSKTFRLDERSGGGTKFNTSTPKAKGLNTYSSGMLAALGGTLSTPSNPLGNFMNLAKQGIKNISREVDKSKSGNISELDGLTDGIQSIIQNPFGEAPGNAFQGAEQLYGNEGPASNIDTGFQLEDVAGSISSEIVPLSTGAGGVDVGALGIGNPTSYGGSAFTSASSLGTMAASNTTATGGLVGAADIAGLAAAEAGATAGAGAAAGGATSALGTTLSTIGSVLPYVGFAIQAYNILDRGLSSRRKPTGLGSDQILAGAEGLGKDPFGNDWEIVTDENGDRYLRDSVTKTNYGMDRYIPIDNEETMDQVRKSHADTSIRRLKQGMDRSGKEELMSARPLSVRDQHEWGSTPKGLGMNQLADLKSTMSGFDTKGRSLADLRGFRSNIKNQYDDYTKDRQDPSYGGLG